MTRAHSEKRGPRSTPKQARAIPDPDSLAMDDRGTGIYQNKEHRPGRRHISEDGNYTGDPIKPQETIRAEEDTESTDRLPESDAPTIIRDAKQ